MERNWLVGRRTRRLVVVVALAGMLLPAIARAANDPSSPACFWHLKLNGKHGINAGWPDNNATYWYAHYTATPGSRIALRGEYPAARFFVIDVYDQKANPYTPELRDATLQPDLGSKNPFTTPSSRGTHRYSAFIEFGPAPTVRAPNTIYAGTTVDGTQPNVAGLLTLRVYLPNDPTSDAGGVALPSAALELPGADSVPLGACPVPDDVSVQPALSDAIQDLGYPAGAPAVAPFPLANNPPQWTANTNPNADWLARDTLGLPDDTPRSGVGLLTSPNMSYISTRISRAHGEVFVMRAKAPTSPNTRAGQWVGTPTQVRYWSVCEFSTMTGQTAACLSDHEIVRDAKGMYTVVISDPAHRPATAANWLPIGDPYDGWPNVRQYLPNPQFREGIGNLPPGADLGSAMGAYLPVSGYCSVAAFEVARAACISQPR
jgi:hypothetical protein